MFRTAPFQPTHCKTARVLGLFVVLTTARDDRGYDMIFGCRGGELQAPHDGGFEFESVFDEEEFWERALLPEVQHAGESGRGRVGEDVEEVGRDAFRPDGHGAAELLQPDLAPVLAHWPREEFEVAQNAEPFV